MGLARRYRRMTSAFAAALIALSAVWGVVGVFASEAGYDIANVWCGETASNDALSAVADILAAADAQNGRSTPNPSGSHDAPCHACPATCASAIASSGPVVAITYASTAPLVRSGARAANLSFARGPPLGGRAPPAL